MKQFNRFFPAFFILFPNLLFAQNRYDIIITEFMADPVPAVGLPASEFIELKNRSAQDYNLHNWQISNGNTTAVIKTDHILRADSILILCNPSSASAFSAFGNVLGVPGMPALSNDAGEIIIMNASGNIQHAIQYDKSWFGNELKASGGWSLEMIDINYPASDKSNWTSSRSPSGGTPGQINSVRAVNPDEDPPALLRCFALDSVHLILQFDEPVDSQSSAISTHYFVSDGIGTPDSALAIASFFDQVSLHFATPLQTGKIYIVTVQNVADCSHNQTGKVYYCKTGLAVKAQAGDLIFNEILFNPPPGGYDYIELYNRSDHVIDASTMFVTSRDASGALRNPVPLFTGSRAFFPGDFLALTENADWVHAHYVIPDSSQIVSLSAVPAMPDDNGSLVMMNNTGDLIDELDYDHHWHSPLISDESGVALERIHSEEPTNQANNWSSASALSGYGTPGYKNSESVIDTESKDFFAIDSKIFSPDMDGYMDFCFIHYGLPSAGYIGSLSIYDITGRVVCTLANNLLLGTSGFFRWDGTDEQKNLLPVGRYIIYAQAFSTDGTVVKQKMVVTLAKKRS